MPATQRVLLVSPPGGAPNLAPCPSLLYLAGALRQADIEVSILDLAAPHGPASPEGLIGEIASFKPGIIGFSVFTETALNVYQLVERIKPLTGALVVAGGPHATALPEEALDHGVDVVVRGEGEQTLVELAAAVDPRSCRSSIAGLSHRGDRGEYEHNRARALIRPLDSLPSPVDVLGMVPRAWYLAGGANGQLPANLVTSRGCVGRCTFCSNVVFGHCYRYHSAARVIGEMEAWYRTEGTQVFNFCDSAFTIHRKRLLSLCGAMVSQPSRPMWSCETRVDRMDEELARSMKRAGCLTVAFGLESGDVGVLSRIKKGIDLEQAASVLKLAKGAGLRTQVNFMFGLPEETPRELENTLRYMERIAPDVDLFSPMGVFVPYPGSWLYERYRDEMGFAGWWLERDRLDRLYRPTTPLAPDASLDDLIRWHAELERSVFELELIPYGDDVIRAIDRCLEFRRECNRSRLAESWRVMEGFSHGGD